MGLHRWMRQMQYGWVREGCLGGRVERSTRRRKMGLHRWMRRTKHRWVREAEYLWWRSGGDKAKAVTAGGGVVVATKQRL